MAVTSRLGILLLEVGQSSKETVISAALSAIDAAIAGLSLANAFLGNNTFAGTSKFGGVVGGNANPLPWASASVTFPSDADYTLGTTVATEKEARYITINAGVITVQRNLIVPTVAGAEWVVTNNQASLGVQVKTVAGTGIVVASQRRAIITCGGAGNCTRVTQDSVTTP